ncbi:MAG: hypothetical protein ABSD58_14785 [Verrucomicrobiia bacterium]
MGRRWRRATIRGFSPDSKTRLTCTSGNVTTPPPSCAPNTNFVTGFDVDVPNGTQKVVVCGDICGKIPRFSEEAGVEEATPDEWREKIAGFILALEEEAGRNHGTDSGRPSDLPQ